MKISMLPFELQLRIASFLPAEDLCRLKTTAIMNDIAIKLNILRNGGALSDKELCSLPAECAHIDDTYLETAFSALLTRHLSAWGWPLFLKERMSTTQKTYIVWLKVVNSAFLPPTGLRKIAKHCPNLRRLSIAPHHQIEHITAFANLEVLCLSYSGITNPIFKNMLLHLKFLKDLNVFGCELLRPGLFRWKGSVAPLEKLNLGKTQICRGDIQNIFTLFTSLTELKLDGCNEIGNTPFVNIYPNHFKIWFWAISKLSQFVDLNRLNINNIEPVKIGKFRCFEAAENPKLEADWV